MTDQLLPASGYLLRGFKLLGRPGIRIFVLGPLLVNILLFAGLSLVAVEQFGNLLDWLTSHIPDWLGFLVWILWALFALLMLILYGYTFTLLSNLIASPFYGLLAERVQNRYDTSIQAEPLTLKSAGVIAWRSFLRELHKLAYFLPRIIGVLLISLVLTFIPVLDLLVPVIAFIWGAWSLAIQYLDYAADNNAIPFDAMKQRLRKKMKSCLGFGGAAMVASSVPLFNLLAMPASVVGATLLWLDHYREPGEAPAVSGTDS